MKVSSLLLVVLGLFVVGVPTSTLAKQQQSNLLGSHQTRLEAHTHQVIQYATIPQHINSPKAVKKEAKAKSAKVPLEMMEAKHSSKSNGAMMEAKSLQLMIGFQ